MSYLGPTTMTPAPAAPTAAPSRCREALTLWAEKKPTTVTSIVTHYFWTGDDLRLTHATGGAVSGRIHYVRDDGRLVVLNTVKGAGPRFFVFDPVKYSAAGWDMALNGGAPI